MAHAAIAHGMTSTAKSIRANWRLIALMGVNCAVWAIAIAGTAALI